jgi:hypothetical protein
MMKMSPYLIALVLLLTSCTSTKVKQISRADSAALRNLSVLGFDRDFEIKYGTTDDREFRDEGTRLWVDVDSVSWMSYEDYSYRRLARTQVRTITFERSQLANGTLAGIGVGLGVGAYVTSKIGGGSDGLGIFPILIGPVVFLIPGMLVGSAIRTANVYEFTQ